MADANPAPRPVNVLLDATSRKRHEVVRGILNCQGWGCAASNRLDTFGFGSIQAAHLVLSLRVASNARSQKHHLCRLRRVGPAVADPDLLPGPAPERLLEKEEHRGYLVGRAIALMQKDFEPTTWKACWEFVVNGRPAAEVASGLCISVNAVYLAKSRVLRALRAELSGFLD